MDESTTSYENDVSVVQKKLDENDKIYNRQDGESIYHIQDCMKFCAYF